MVFLIFFFLSSDNKKSWEDQLNKYSEIFTIIKENYPGHFDKERIVFSSIKGLLRTLDPHSYFLDPLTLRSMFEDQHGNYYGIGIRIIKYEDRLTVVSPLKDTPAYKLGIISGDIIIEIEGKSTKEMPIDEAMKKLRGARGTTVNIKILRKGIEHPIPFQIKRAEIPLNSISYSLTHPLNPGIGYISIRTFGNTTEDEFKKNLDKLIKEDDIKGLILDLRGNAGGSLYAAIDISEFFLEKGKEIVSIKGRTVNQKFVAKKNNQYEDIPLAVLINRQSASASEIVASALKDHKKAIIIGTRSWGKGLVETLMRLPMNSAIALTTAKYYTPSNQSIQRDFSAYDDYFSILYQKDYDHDKTISGGVFPDIYVKGELYHPFIVRLLSNGVFFRFSRELIDNHYRITKNFTADKKIIRKFKSFLAKNKIKFDAKVLHQNMDNIKFEIERDVLSTAFSMEEGVKIFLKSDPVTKKALDMLTNTKNKGV